MILNENNLRSTYLSAPLVDLKNALICVETSLPNVNSSYIDYFKKYTSTNNLTQDEAAAIKVYTGTSVYKSLNNALRTEELEKIRPWFAYLKLFHTGVTKLPPEDGVFCRGENTHWIDSYQRGSIVNFVSQLFLINIYLFIWLRQI